MSGTDAAVTEGRTDGHLAFIFTLIHSFLTSRSHVKAAAAVKRAAKDTVILRDDVQIEGATLEEIVKWWKLKTEIDSKNKSESESSSASDSGDSSSSNDSTSSSDSSSFSDSDSGSSSDESSDSSADSSQPKPTNPSKSKAGSVGDNVVCQNKPNKPTSKKGQPKESNPSDTSSDESSSSGSDSNSDKNSHSPERKCATDWTETIKTTTVPVTAPEATRTTKKRRTSESGNATATAVVTETEAIATPKSNGKENGKKPRKSNTPFQRIKVDQVEFHDDRLRDNAFVARGASANDYGARANQDLIVTRGDSFRKEKNKKKRGSYRGGEITARLLQLPVYFLLTSTFNQMQSHSIKFT